MPAAISVIIPSALKTVPGSEELWIERAIRSILAQTHLPTEVIVGLDPGVESPRLPSLHAGWLLEMCVARGDKKGHQSACNAAVKQASSPLIAFLEDDDTWEPNHLETLLVAMNDYGADLVTASQMEVDESGELGVFDFPTCSSWLVSRLAWKTIGGFDTRFTVHHDNVFLGECHQRGIRRLHVVEHGADIDRKGWNGVPWLRQISHFCQIASMDNLKRPSVNRWKHADSVLGQTKPGGEKRERAAREYVTLSVLYGCIPW